MSFVNCSTTIPVSETYFAAIDSSVRGLIGIAGAVTLITLVLLMEHLVYVIKTYPLVTRFKTCWIIGLFPVTMVTALMSLCVPRSTVLNDLVASVYLSITMHLFMNVIIDYYGGEAKVIETMAGSPFSLRTPPCCCCCCCCPTVKISKKNLLRLRLLVLQVAFIRPILLLIAAILWTDLKYVAGKFSGDSAYAYISILGAVSTLLAMYGLIIMMRASTTLLDGGMLRGKFAGLQLVLIICNLQGFIFTTLARYNIPACTEILTSELRGRVFHYLLLVLEMFLLALHSRYVYRRPQKYPILEPESAIVTPTRTREEVGIDNASLMVNGGTSGGGNYNSCAHSNSAFAKEDDVN